MYDEITLYDSERTFRRVLAVLLLFYLAGVVLIQVKGESLRYLAPAPSPKEPPRMAKILPVPPRISPTPPIEVKRDPLPLPPPSAAQVESFDPPRADPEQTSTVEKQEAALASPPLSSSPSPSSSRGRAEKPSREEMKKVGLLGLLGGGKGSNPSLGKKFSSLKETPLLSAEESPLPSSEERIETIRQRTVVGEEIRLALTRKGAAGENLSETKIFREGPELDRDAVSDIVHQKREELLALYNRRLKKNPNVQGHLTVEFIISPQGEVLKCRIVSSSLSDPVFENEIVREIFRWKFPAAEQGSTTVFYPLSFFPAG